MRHRKEEQLDNFIRSKIQGLGRPKYQIEPSADFSQRLFVKIAAINRRKRWMGYLLAVVLSMVPLAVREAWLFIRGDYFSIANLPMGHLIVGAYRFFLSPVALYILLALGILAFLFRASKLRRSHDSLMRIA